jgi:rare lipoprotein A
MKYSISIKSYIYLLFLLIFVVYINLTSENIKIARNLYIEPNIIEDLIITQTGIASHYSTKFHKRKTASGERFDLFAYTSAHKRLPFGTIIKVINIDNNMTTLAKINDRGPFVRGRIIDLSHKTAKMINGFDNPNVEIQYFDNNKIIKNIDSNYFLGYSLSEPFIIANKNTIDFIDSTDSFEGAMNIYLNTIDDNTTSIKYLFLKAKKTSKQQKYFIGFADPKNFIQN